LDAVEAGHGDIHDQDIRRQIPYQVDGLAPIRRFTDNLDILRLFQ
jgi:hypothetical protein